MKRCLLFILILFFSITVQAMSSYTASYELHSKTDLGNLKVGNAKFELTVANNAYVFSSVATTDTLWKALYDYSRKETSIGLIEDNKLTSSYYKIIENQANSVADNYEINIYPDEYYASLNNEIKWKTGSGEIVDELSIYLHISEDIQKFPDKKVFTYHIVGKKGIREQKFTIDGNETISVRNKEVETIRIICPELRLIFNVSKDYNFMPVLINKTNGKHKYILTLKEFKKQS